MRPGRPSASAFWPWARAASLAPIDKVNIAEKLAQILRPWDPRVVGELNGQHVRLAKLLGTFDWHSHAEEVELFLVVEGEFDPRARRTSNRTGEVVDVARRGLDFSPMSCACLGAACGWSRDVDRDAIPRHTVRPA